MNPYWKTIMILRLSREDHFFDLGLEIGNIDGYCTAILELVLEAIAMERFNTQYIHTGARSDYSVPWKIQFPGTGAVEYLQNYERILSRFVYMTGGKFDTERIIDDLMTVYEWVADPIDQEFPDWSMQAPAKIEFTLTPGSFQFEISK
jgi:hypothetical protein